MRIFNQIILIAISLLIVFAVTTNYNSLFSKGSSYVVEMVKDTISLYRNGGYENSLNDAIVHNNVYDDNSNSPSQTTDKVISPGALVVSDNLLTNNINKINLSSKNVITITNKQRKDNGGLPPLVENSKLNFSAEKKLQDMFTKGYFEHVSPSGVSVSDLGSQFGYEYILIGENLAMGNFKDNEALVDAWMASPGHRANIMNNRYQDIGVAVGKGTYQGKDVWMAVQHFGLPKSACTTIDEVLKGMISFDQNKIKEMESDLSSKRAKIESGAVSEGMTTNGQIEAYNSLVKDYNNLILDIKEKINTYNKQVQSFNQCIEGFK